MTTKNWCSVCGTEWWTDDDRGGSDCPQSNDWTHHHASKPQFHAWIELAGGTGRPEAPRVDNGEIAPWVKNAQFLPWAADLPDACIVGTFATADEAWAAINEMITRDENNFIQWA